MSDVINIRIVDGLKDCSSVIDKIKSSFPSSAVNVASDQVSAIKLKISEIGDVVIRLFDTSNCANYPMDATICCLDPARLNLHKDYNNILRGVERFDMSIPRAILLNNIELVDEQGVVSLANYQAVQQDVLRLRRAAGSDIHVYWNGSNSDPHKYNALVIELTINVLRRRFSQLAEEGCAMSEKNGNACHYCNPNLYYRYDCYCCQNRRYDRCGENR
jgi:hypothetical protein